MVKLGMVFPWILMVSYGKTMVFLWKTMVFLWIPMVKPWFSGEYLPKTVSSKRDRVHFREPSTAFGAALEVGFVLLFYHFIYSCFFFFNGIYIYYMYIYILCIYILYVYIVFCFLFDVLLFKTINWSYLFHSFLLNWHIERDIEHFWNNRRYACVCVYTYVYIYIYPNWCSGL